MYKFANRLLFFFCFFFNFNNYASKMSLFGSFLRLFCCFLLIALLQSCGNKETPNQDKAIGEQIRQARLKRGISQEEMARALGISQNAVSLIEDGFAAPIHTRRKEIEDYLQIDLPE